MKLKHTLLIALLVTSAFTFAACSNAGEKTATETKASTGSTLPRVVTRSAEASELRVVKADALPAPFATEAVGNAPTVVPQPENAKLEVPRGFDVTVFAEGNFERPRWLIEGANGDLFLSDAKANNITLLRDANKDGRIDNATERFAFVEGLNRPLGMAIHGEWFYVGNTDAVVRWKYQPGATKLEGKPEKIADLPAGEQNNHWARNLLFSADGKKLYVSVGSASNVEVEAEPRRAAISVYDPDGKNHRIFAAGLRNPTGLAWNPITNDLWTTVNERDGLGDDLVPDYATSVKEGKFYGWPYSYIGQNPDPRRKERPDLVKKAIAPDVLFEAHAAALGIVFYTGSQFPEEYKNDAFVALHGSWNRSKRHGYKVVHIPFKDGQPEGGYYDFLSGWAPDAAAKEVWGRPVGLLMSSDGSLLVVDDGGNKVWRVSYKK